MDQVTFNLIISALSYVLGALSVLVIGLVFAKQKGLLGDNHWHKYIPHQIRWDSQDGSWRLRFQCSVCGRLYEEENVRRERRLKLGIKGEEYMSYTASHGKIDLDSVQGEDVWHKVKLFEPEE